MGEELLPGIPDAITLSKIVTKLPWRVLHISSISSAWRDAIRSRQVYEERVHSNSTETVVIINYTHDHADTPLHFIALYSMRDYSFVQLPTIPSYIKLGFECVCLDGKIYILGGEVDSVGKVGSNAMYVLDVAGLRQWKRCASMTQPRQMFACGVMNGKIYVFGGISSKEPVCESEVYDPKENSWSRITPMKSLRYGHAIEIVGKKFRVLGGECFDRNYFDPVTNRMLVHGHVLANDLDFTEVYDPVNDEWEIMDGTRNMRGGQPFLVSGKLYFLHSADYEHHVIQIYDRKENRWSQLHTFSPPKNWPEMLEKESRTVFLLCPWITSF